ncbi:UNVERIFIED_CONTAM: hypothetical protein FKN15_066485 [Acipenser sinensis]
MLHQRMASTSFAHTASRRARQVQRAFKTCSPGHFRFCTLLFRKCDLELICIA